MPRRLTELRVFVASPGDLDAERDAATNVIQRLNLQVAEPRGVFLKLLQFPLDIHPGVGSEPQEVINLQIQDCDIYVVLFWKRLGTPTRKHASGTVEEFQQAYGKWLSDPRTRVRVYFSQRPFFPKPDEVSELTRLFQFKKNLSRIGVLYSTFDSLQEFELRLSEHLARIVLEREAVGHMDQLNFLYQLGVAKNFTRDMIDFEEETDQLAVIYIDLDQFKDINRTLNPERGTEVLNELACSMFNVVRNRAHLYRYAGDEFVVAVCNRPQEETVNMAEKIRGAIAACGPYNGHRITASLGVACTPTIPKGDLFKAAYRAAYVSKIAGKNCTTVCPLTNPQIASVKNAEGRNFS